MSEMEIDDHDDHEEEGSAHHGSARAKMAAKFPTSRYRECLKNHAVNLGGHALDGCGEFMPAGEENTLDALKCAACGCHRNFHRNESLSEGGRELGFIHHHPHPHPHPLPHHQQQQFASPYYRTPAAGYVHVAPPPHYRPPQALALPSTSGGGAGTEPDEQEDVSNPSGDGGRGGVSGVVGKKRFRTKFTAEQKEKMLAFAESLGWRIQKHDEEAVEQFCRETGVKRPVLKVWMHNNKHSLGKKP